MGKVDTTKPVSFYDDRNKDQTIWFLKQILYEDDEVCFCIAKSGQLGGVSPETKILFDKQTGSVQSCDMMFWYATNTNPLLEI